MTLSKVEKLCIRAYADNCMRRGAAAKSIHYHRSSVGYHLDRIREKTGLDPRNFYDLVKLIGELDEKDAPEE